MKLVWVVRNDYIRPSSGGVLFETFLEALEDFKSHEWPRFIYPRLISKKEFNNLKEHTGW